ncbi:uncharacterized protein LOC133359407 [Lethenteron reissneri]|uniref:uncharacterized protein LOC133359407 n=1 Tax=Lethenteron reissneri TaxID=7753 RepID=UPI002AB630B3|nr:uncharacterized protein LOC133359407 [Lethenteron reissneri]
MAPWTAMRRLLLLLLLLLGSLHEPSLADECGDEFYKSPEGFCCVLCRAGTYKVMDCISGGGNGMCDLCPKGSFMSRDNSEEMCMPCSSCGPDEEAVVNCFMAQDTECWCREGLKRDADDSQRCVPDDSRTGVHQGYKTAAIGLAFTLVSILALKLGVIVFKGRDLPTLGCTYQHGAAIEGYRIVPSQILEMQTDGYQVKIGSEAVNLTCDSSENIKASIRVDPSHLLQHLHHFKMIPANVYEEAKDRSRRECVELILSHFTSQGELGCEKLWEVLYYFSNNYVQLRKKVHSSGVAVRSVHSKHADLKAWIGKNPGQLLELLMRQGRITTELLTRARGERDEYECAARILDYFVERGNDDCLKLLLTLQDVGPVYPEVEQWLRSLEFLKEISNTFIVCLNRHSDHVLHDRIRLNKTTLIRALAKGPNMLIAQLHNRGFLTNNHRQMLINMDSTEATVQLLDFVLSKDQWSAKAFWELLWELKNSYPQLGDTFDGFLRKQVEAKSKLAG